ncbi:MAG: hypothetical protein U1F77_16780 [Kiritimatiellia bacterium]
MPSSISAVCRLAVWRSRSGVRASIARMIHGIAAAPSATFTTLNIWCPAATRTASDRLPSAASHAVLHVPRCAPSTMG